MSDKIGELEKGQFGVIVVGEHHQIHQIGLTKQQNTMLKMFLSAIVKEDGSLIKLPKKYDLTLKNK